MVQPATVGSNWPRLDGLAVLLGVQFEGLGFGKAIIESDVPDVLAVLERRADREFVTALKQLVEGRVDRWGLHRYRPPFADGSNFPHAVGVPTSSAIAHTKPASWRAMAVVTVVIGFPARLSFRY